jgi:hypothetical protein
MGSKKLEPEITFSIEIRPTTREQREAGKRLFTRLINRTLADKKYSDTAKAWAQAEGGASPAASQNIDKQLAKDEPPSLTNRGASTYKTKNDET